MKAKMKTRKIGSRFGRLSGLIGGLFEHKYDHVFDDTVKGTIAIKPIFIGDMTKMNLNGMNINILLNYLINNE